MRVQIAIESMERENRDVLRRIKETMATTAAAVDDGSLTFGQGTEAPDESEDDSAAIDPEAASSTSAVPVCFSPVLPTSSFTMYPQPAACIHHSEIKASGALTTSARRLPSAAYASAAELLEILKRP